MVKTKQKMKCKAVFRLSSQSSTVCRYIEYILFVSGAASRCVHHRDRTDQSLSQSLLAESQIKHMLTHNICVCVCVCVLCL